MIITIFRIKCDGDCQRFLSDIRMDGTPSMTARPSAALAFTTVGDAAEKAAQVFQDGRCPRCAPKAP